MQMSFQLVKRASRRARLGGFLAAGLAAAPAFAPACAQELDSGWTRLRISSARLIAAPSADGWRAGVEIRLDPDVLTYWRTPGDAGAPPEFDFSASENVDKASVRYPVPTRFLEDGLNVFGYRDDVVFPLDLRLKDPGKPAKLALSMNYAVCGKICVPVTARLTLALPRVAAGGAPGEHEERLLAAQAKTPRPLAAGESARKVSMTREPGAARPTWRLRLRDGAEPSAPADLFAEAPPGWFFETRPGDAPGEFLIVQTEQPEGARHASVVLTLSGPQAYEFTVELDARRAVADGAPDREGEETQ